MRKNIKTFIKNFFYNFSAQLLSTVISMITVFLIPKIVGTEGYGYVQLYIFYASYTAYMSFGISDGIYIRYGGYEYENINKPIIAGQYWIVSIALVLLGSGIVAGAAGCGIDSQKIVMLFWSMLSALITVPRSLVNFLLLTTNHIKNASKITIIERCTYFCVCVILLSLRVEDPMPYIYADIIGKITASVCMFILYTELVYIPRIDLKPVICELKSNLFVGIKIVSASIVGLFIIGIVRFEISNEWNMTIFGKVSLALSIANLLLAFINTLSVVLFPVICRCTEEVLRKFYNILDHSLQIVLVIVLAMYYPMKVLLNLWLPQYEDSMEYMALIFPICLFECKVSLILNTYFKALRAEKYILFVNILAALISIILSTICVYVLHNLVLAICVITVALGIRCIFSELVIKKILQINNLKSIFIEICISIAFIVMNWFVGGYLGFALYMLVVILYVFFSKKQLIYMKNELKILFYKAEEEYI